MTPLLNELLEEAITRANELAEESVEAGHEASLLAQSARELHEETQRRAHMAHQRFDTLQRQLVEARAERELIGEGVSAGLEAARQRAGEMEQHVTELLESAGKNLEAMQEQRERLREGFAERIRETQEQVSRLVGQLDELEAAAGSAMGEVRTACGRLAQRVSETREHLQERSAVWSDTASGLRGGLEQSVARLVMRHVHVLSLHTSRLEEVKKRLADEHNTAVAALMEALTEDSLDEMSTRLQPLFDAAERVEEDWFGAEESLLEGYRTLGQRVNEVAEKLDEAEDAAVRVEGELS